MEAGHSEGTEEVPVLFEEMDGVWLFMQDGNHKKMKKQELKVFTMYEGWDAESKGCSRLVWKEMLGYIQIYADSVKSNEETDKRSSNARKL